MFVLTLYKTCRILVGKNQNGDKKSRGYLVDKMERKNHTHANFRVLLKLLGENGRQRKTERSPVVILTGQHQLNYQDRIKKPHRCAFTELKFENEHGDPIWLEAGVITNLEGR